MAILRPAFILGVFMIFASTQLNGECCTNHNWEYCDNWCCGCGACNIFCCNCADGCNLHWWHNSIYMHTTPPYGAVWDPTFPGDWTNWLEAHGHEKSCTHRRKRMVSNTKRNSTWEALNLFKSIDVDENNTICTGEAYAYFKNQTNIKRSITYSQLEKDMKIMDKNNDGLISPGEFDNNLEI